jgi:8-oxo-dGTP pyrophosphatase MutT (NUDIX family)
VYIDEVLKPMHLEERTSVLKSTTNAFAGVVTDPEGLPTLPEEFRHVLGQSLQVWRAEGLKVVWLEIPIGKSALIPVAVEAGFSFHHSGRDYLMLTCQLEAGAHVPPYASHYIGAGGVVLNDRGELLVVWERTHRRGRRRYYKLPGGALHQGEHLVAGVIREIEEETGVLTRFESLVCFRHWHGYRFGKSDIYFVCRLSPLSLEIRRQEEEIAECLWMPVQDYLSSEYVGVFNRRIVEAALKGGDPLVPVWIEGYQTDDNAREIFMPRDGQSTPSA